LPTTASITTVANTIGKMLKLGWRTTIIALPCYTISRASTRHQATTRAPYSPKCVEYEFSEVH
jgi:hypothetical protein